MKEKFDITGMTCSSCAAHVEKAVNKLDGTKDVNVNLMQNMLQVDHDDSVSSEDIIQAVEKAGYGASSKQAKKATENTAVKQADLETSMMKKRLIISIVFLIPLLYISMGYMFGLPVPAFLNGLENAVTYGMFQFLLTLVITYVNRNYFINGFKSLWHRAPTMDALIAIGSTAAIVYGIYAIIQMGIGLAQQDFMLVEQFHMDLYFESAGTILTLITVGKFLETRSKGKTNDAISKLMDLAPKTAFVEKDGQVSEVSIEDVVKGDILVVKSGSSIPVDGVIVDGASTINEAAITGESLPVEKQQGDNVTGGTISVSGFIKMQATRVGEDTTLSQIIKLVEDANSSKAPIAKLADKVSGVFVPIVIVVAFSTTIIWLFAGASVSFSLSIGIAVLIISCPCALGLATPTAIMVGTGKGAENGILFKTAESLEMAQSVNVIVMDKTGTVTEGKPKVTDIYTAEQISQEYLMKIAASAEHVSEHPLAHAIVEKAKEMNISFEEVDDFTQIAGQGIKVTQADKIILAGNEKMMIENKINIDYFKKQSDALAEQGKTPLYFSENDTLLGMVALADTVKVNSRQAIQKLQNMGIDVVLLTGDNKRTAHAIGQQLGVKNIVSEVLPQEKEKHIRDLIAQGKKVAMVGDGINDAPALARADVGIAIGAGTDIAIESADIVLMKSDLLDVVTMVQLSKATIRNIKQNLFWAFIYNIIGIPLAAGVFYPMFELKLNPMFGSAAMSLSSLFVVSNALRLRFFKPNLSVKEGKEITIQVETMKHEGENTMKKMKIEGMTCKNCVAHVEKALNEIDGVHATVDLDSNSADVTLDKDVSDKTLTDAVTEAGYSVTDIK